MAGETAEGHGNGCIFRNHGITLRSKTDALDGVQITSRCLRYEQNTVDFGISDSENLCSKIYLLRVEDSDITLKVKIKLPVFQGHGEGEELIIKTGGGKEVKVTKTKRSKRKGWFATFRCKINKEITFVVVCRKLDEHQHQLVYAYPKDDLDSCLDTTRASVNSGDLQDTTRDSDATDSCQDTVRSSSRSLYSSMSREEYDVVFLVMSKLSEDAKEVTELIIDCSAVLKATVNKLFWEKKGFHRQLQSVVCKTHAKQTFNILIPAKDKDVIKDDRKEIITLQFHPLRPNFIKYKLHCDHSTLRKLLGQIEIVKEALPVNEASDVELEKHNISLSVVLLKVYEESELTKEDNIQGDLVSQKEFECNELSLSIKSENRERDMLQEKLFESKADRNEDLKLPTDAIQNKMKHIDTVFAEEMIDVNLTEQVKHPDIIESKDEPAKDWIQRECLNDQLLACLHDLFSDSWLDILLLLGIPFTTIEQELKTLSDGRTLDDITRKLFKQWRDSNNTHADKGIPQLITTFQKCGKIDCSHFLRLAIKDWRIQTEVQRDPLNVWLEQAYADPDMFTPTSYPRPMSDQYLTLITSGITPTVELASKLSISEEGYNRVAENPSFPDDKTKVMKLLTLFREKSVSTETALSGLLDALMDLEYRDQRSRGMACASGWFNRHAEEKDEVKTTVKRVLEKAKNAQPRPKPFERKWALVKRKIASGLQFSRQKSIQASKVTDPSSAARSQVHQGFFG